ncbi:MAG: hypothetical protein UV63_C0004G0015 [Microgenomates group bacterium GW2011_GWC1_43_11]|uniref:Uncharacterized protein n=1 Tax=Candidatus Gottesmanbacteria bacterium GW2011_GWB1_44_11c TaxID=1618447 RepID=A0A0G1GNS8_9BACT|nr:MAG: hypothetical protein UV63_C0004G0015 [Microgenomates group bacterium GW2011_GWC1_43_11]KKT36626.1 MAG: hypothetical protein UW22_C0036G0014 [Candidatus Gottesmanbacteria bacterium GW2011_GWB1_44_11c]
MVRRDAFKWRRWGTNLDSEEKVANTAGATGYLVKANTRKDKIVKLVMECLKRSPEPPNIL